MTIEIYETIPLNFKPQREVVGCLVEMEGKILFLKRAPHCPEPNVWCIPGGKMEADEKPEESIVRELFEETGIRTTAPFTKMGTLYCKRPLFHYPFHIFSVKLTGKNPVTISSEHLDYIWVLPSEITKLDLISGAEEIVRKMYKPD